MSALEKAVIPLLTPLIKGQPAVLGITEQETVARWAWKTAVMYEYGLFNSFGKHRARRIPVHVGPVFGRSDRHGLYQEKPIPDGTFVSIFAHLGPKTARCLDPHYDPLLIDRQFLPLKSFKFTAAIGYFGFQVSAFRWPEHFRSPSLASFSGENTPDELKSVVFRIHPALSPLQWPPSMGMDSDALIWLNGDKKID
jgi:hypothetical protein